MKIIGYEKRICAFRGCKRPTRNKGSYKGRTRYDKWCEFHHRLRYRECTSVYLREYNRSRDRVDNSKCEKCGWDKAPCDRHRIDPKKGYTKENVMVLCPNCHRLETLGILSKVV